MVRHACGKVWPGAIAVGAMLTAVACEPGQISGLRGSSDDGAGSSGSVGPNGPNGPGGGKGGSGNPSNPGAGGSAPSIAEEAAACDNTPVSPGPSFVRRLNKFEYANTVRDLLGVTDDPTDQFPSEEKRLGFDNNATALQVSPSLV